MSASNLLKVPAYVWHHPENRHRKLRSMARLSGWQCWQRLVRRPIEIKLDSPLRQLANPPRLRCYPHSMIASAVLYCGFNEHQDMHFANDFLADGDVFIDVGANIGVYSLLAAATPGVEIFAFEPSADAQTRARENISLNGFNDRIHLIGAAAGAAQGVGHLTVGQDAMNRLLEEPAPGAETVEVVTVDSAIPDSKWGRVSLVKIDVEGGEGGVIEGAASLIKRARPALIVEAGSEETIQLLLGDEYSPYAYAPETRRLSPTTWETPSGNNHLLICDLEQAQRRLARR